MYMPPHLTDSKGGIQDKASGGKKTKEDRKREKAEKAGSSKKDEESSSGTRSAGWDRRQEVIAPEADEDADDGDWSMDTSAEAVKEREDKALVRRPR